MCAFKIVSRLCNVWSQQNNTTAFALTIFQSVCMTFNLLVHIKETAITKISLEYSEILLHQVTKEQVFLHRRKPPVNHKMNLFINLIMRLKYERNNNYLVWFMAALNYYHVYVLLLLTSIS